MEAIPVLSPIELSVQLTDLSIANDIKRLLKRMNGVGRISVTHRKSELDLSLEDIHTGNVVEVGSVKQMMDYLHA